MSKTNHDLITVLIIGTHDLFHKSLEYLMSMESDIDLVGSRVTVEDLTEKSLEMNPDVILIDLTIAETESLAPIKTIHTAFPNTSLIAMSGFPTNEQVDTLIQNGVTKFIKRGDSAQGIVSAIREVGHVG